MTFASVDQAIALLDGADYLAGRELGTVVFLALALDKPLLLEGEAGVGKTEVAKALARALGRPLLRLQCYEGLDLASAAYEWDHARQMLAIRVAEAAGDTGRERLEAEIFSPRYLLPRPLLAAVDFDPGAPAPVLLIDELDRADEPFEAFLLEVLSDFQITIPEIGVVRAPRPPLVVLTSNRTREIHDAVKRRCLYHWIDYPDAERELAIVRRRLPGTAEALSREVVGFVQRLRGAGLFKPPGIAETLDWAAALTALDRTSLDPQTLEQTLGALLKYQEDVARIRGEEARRLLAETRGHG